jgi:hypothetical protein
MDTTSLAAIKGVLSSAKMRDIIERDLGKLEFMLKDGIFTVTLAGFLNLGMMPHDFTGSGKTRAEAVEGLFWQLICSHHHYPAELIAKPKSIQNIPVTPHPSTLPGVRKITLSSSLRNLWQDKDGRILSDVIKIPDLSEVKTFDFNPDTLSFNEVDFEKDLERVLKDAAGHPDKKARLELVFGVSGIAAFYARFRDKVESILKQDAQP